MTHYPDEDKCETCESHIGWVTSPAGEDFRLGKCERCYENERLATLAVQHYSVGSYREEDYEGKQIDNKEFVQEHQQLLDEIEMTLLDIVSSKIRELRNADPTL